jgi:hypothetical protein
MPNIEGFDTDKLVCTFCGERPVVGFTFVVSGESFDASTPLEGLDEKSFVAVCKKHLPILQEQMEEAQRDGAEITTEIIEEEEDSDE